MKDKYHPKKGERFTAFVIKTLVEDGKPCDIKTTNGPYICCKRQLHSNKAVKGIIGADSMAEFRTFKVTGNYQFLFPRYII